jgi:hypothetical protein
MDLNLMLPFVSTAIMIVFTISVFRRWSVRRRPHLLFWGIGLGLFAIASFTEAYFAAVGWSDLVFFGWYFFGAVLTAGWIGHGTFLLLVRKRWGRYLTGILILGSLAAFVLMLQVMPTLDQSLFDQETPLSEQYRTDIIEEGEEISPGAVVADIEYQGEIVTVQKGIMPLGAPIRRATIFFNIYGTLMLVGGALWSSWLFLRKQVLPNRVMGNILIAVGALAIASASTLTRFGLGGYLYLGELVAAILMYAGFTLAARPATEEEPVPESASVMA